jgi:hypothetical protein
LTNGGSRQTKYSKMKKNVNSNYEKVNDLTAEDVKTLYGLEDYSMEKIKALIDYVQFFTLLVYDNDTGKDQSAKLLETDFINVQKAA